ncbi:hypothetical protein Tco_0393965 [Tanacetum coccineum]
MSTSAALRRNMEMDPDTENMTISEYLEYKAAKERRLWDVFDPKEVQQSIMRQMLTLFTRIRSNDVDIKNITIAEYNLYYAKQGLGMNPLSNHSYGFTPQFFAQPPHIPNTSKKDSDFDKILDDLFRTGAENIKRIGHDIVQDSIWEQDDDSEENQEEDGDDEDTFDMWDITVEDVERIRKFFNVPDEIDEIDNEDVHDLESVETKFPAIVFNDTLTSKATLSCEPTVSSLNDNKIDFRISFDESDDEDYTVVFDKNSFSYKIISAYDLKTDSKNDNEKVNMPLFASPEPSVSCIDDLDFFKDFENEFRAIVYNDALTSKSDFSTLCPQHINEFNLKDETSLSAYDEEEQNVLYFNDLFPFNVIYPDDLKSDKDNDDDKIDIKQSAGDMSVIPLPNVINTDDGANAHGSNKLLETSHDESNKFFKTKTFIKGLNFNIMTWNHLNKGMSFIFLIKNLYVPFCIPFDPKLFYKDEIKLGQV